MELHVNWTPWSFLERLWASTPSLCVRSCDRISAARSASLRWNTVCLLPSMPALAMGDLVVGLTLTDAFTLRLSRLESAREARGVRPCAAIDAYVVLDEPSCCFSKIGSGPTVLISRSRFPKLLFRSRSPNPHGNAASSWHFRANSMLAVSSGISEVSELAWDDIFEEPPPVLNTCIASTVEPMVFMDPTLMVLVTLFVRRCLEEDGFFSRSEPPPAPTLVTKL
mmetsp:Transcript_859/g.2418  ORF Transcript_859/g.2418 Transcript_859/m.2418 type:complete len:224 (+) Transcript_859:156-827(+)